MVEDVLATIPVSGSPSPENASDPVRRGSERTFKHIRELDGVRGLAALAVFFHHVCYEKIPAEGWGVGLTIIHTLSYWGSYGVDLFFVLSGFLITSLLLQDKDSSRYYHDFYWKRALRILPLYFVCLLGVYLFFPASGESDLLSAFFLANFAPLFHTELWGPFWTLAIEEQFYLVWPTMVRRIKNLERFAVASIVMVILLRIVAAAFGKYNYRYTFFRCDGLLLGAWIACRLRRYTKGELRRLFPAALPYLVVLTVAGLLLAYHSLEYSGLPLFPFAASFLQTAATLICGLFIGFIVSHQDRWYVSLFRAKPLTFLGLISYALYLTHIYVIAAYDHLAGPVQAGNSPAFALRLLIVFVGTVAVSLISRYCLELPTASLRKYVIGSAPGRRAKDRA